MTQAKISKRKKIISSYEMTSLHIYLSRILDQYTLLNIPSFLIKRKLLLALSIIFHSLILKSIENEVLICLSVKSEKNVKTNKSQGHNRDLICFFAVEHQLRILTFQTSYLQQVFVYCIRCCHIRFLICCLPTPLSLILSLSLSLSLSFFLIHLFLISLVFMCMQTNTFSYLPTVQYSNPVNALTATRYMATALP